MATEQRLIDANALEQHCKNTKIIELFPEWKDFPYAMKIALIRYGKAWKEIIQNTPTVDAVEVVRCKDCKHYMLWEDSDDEKTCAKSIGLMVSAPDDFCSYGERKMVNLEDIVDLDAQTKANNEAMRKVIAFMAGERRTND